MSDGVERPEVFVDISSDIAELGLADDAGMVDGRSRLRSLGEQTLLTGAVVLVFALIWELLSRWDPSFWPA
ncbi:MAG: hypothetical protein OEM39_04680, partial [Acidimicrobiia bacterium]|nr:hypothetical protein [Acidimicrobiia bacterium]